ncbi:hypothetical protein BGZ49_007793 [Haplosporangium sp. Z 27]|nr:hypothetical protein BGZ49_007793 [Haplosporangium sp. Z 27]
MLVDIDEPTFPFGLSNIHQDRSDISEYHRTLSQDLNDRLRSQATQMGVSLSSIFHVAWAQVLARASGLERVVFGTVLSGEEQNVWRSDSSSRTPTNILPFRCDVDYQSSRERVLLTNVQLIELMKHKHACPSMAQRCSGVSAGTPLFSSILNYQYTSLTPNDDLPESRVRSTGADNAKVYPFAMIIRDFGDNISMTSQAINAINPTRVDGYMSQALESLVEALESTPDMPVLQLEVLPQEERTLLLQEWNSTTMDFPQFQTIHGMVEDQVKRTPSATALVFKDQSMTYSELNSRANQLAHYLIELGLRPDALVAICVERSLAMIISVLGVLKAGGAYVPLDPTYPKDRLFGILEETSPTVVLADVTGQVVLKEAGLDRLCYKVTVLDPNEPLPTPMDNPEVPGLTSRHLAYVIYTSGSTGRPKGVMIEHQGVVNHTLFRQEDFGLEDTSRVLQFASLNFDLSVMETFAALFSGASLHILPNNIRFNLRELWSYLDRNSITQAVLPPALLQDCKGLPPLKTKLTIITCGEPLPATLIRKLQVLMPNGRIVNEYGPTEISITVTGWKCPENFDSDVVLIGRPIANKKLYLLNDHRQPMPLGAVGEVYIGGVGVAREYLGRPELSAKAFLPDPFAGVPEARMYKTGDLAKYLPDGNLVFLGRNDHQVKIRGFRVELGEVESRLIEHPQVEKAAVLAIGEGNNKKLVAYVFAEPSTQLVNNLRSYLSSSLPDYMVPAAIVCLDKLPLTPNGKIDRKALPAPDSSAFASEAYEEPQGEVEIAVADIWADLLHLDRVSRNDNFFALGGHSLLSVQFIERLREINLTLPVSTLFKTPVLKTIAQSITKDRALVIPSNLITPEATAITPAMLPLVKLSQSEIDHIVQQVPGGVASIQDIYTLSPLQEGILFHHMLATKGDPYLIISCTAFASRELLDSYLNAVQQVVDRHDILRTSFMWENLSNPVQIVSRHSQLSVVEHQLNPSDGPIKDQLMEHLDPRQYRIDLRQAPLLRFAIAKDTDDRWIVAELLHHLVGDHSTSETVNTEVKAFMEGRGNMLPPPQPFRNLIAQSQAISSHDDHKKFFTDMLSDIDTPSLPYGLTDVYGEGKEVTTSYQPLEQGLNDRLRNLAKELGVSVASICHLAWAQVISRTSGENRVVFGTVLLGRINSGPETDRALGLFINTLPFRVDVNGGVREGVIQTHERLASLLEHEHAPLALAQQCSSISQGIPLFSALLNYRHSSLSSDETLIHPGIEYLESQARTNYPLTMAVEDYGSALGLTAVSVKPLSSERMCGYMVQALQSLADVLEHASDITIDQMNIQPFEERQLLIEKWNATEDDFPRNVCMNSLFEQQVERTPEATALVFKGQSLTYAELNIRSNILAHRLISLGVKPDMLIATCVERSLAMIIGIIAILKAGGAYVPLDPAYASERLRCIIADAQPSIVLADTTGRKALGEDVLSSLTALDPNVLPDVRIESNPLVSGLTPQNLAYVIYTSGSTGTPKGVLIEHHNAVNMAHHRPEFFGVDSSSRVLQFTSLSFDHSVSEIFPALFCGASLHLIQEDTRLDRRQLCDYLSNQSITHLSITPTLLQDTKDLPILSTLKTLIVMGEELPPSRLQALRDLIPNGYVYNEYGPTEITVCATAWKCPQDFSGDVVPIGKALPNKRIYILDKHSQPVPLGALGELYIGGVGVARGYLNRPDLTARVFLPDPFSNIPEARMYKTGDLARYLPDGHIVFNGRNDHQVKIRGFRVELGEIEARLSEHPQVNKAVVLAIGQGMEKKLVAYVVAKPDDQLVNTLRKYLSTCLPDYMIPSAIVQLDLLPLTSNGKLNRNALPAPDISAFAREVYEAPQGEIETAVAHIWSELLHVDQVSRNDNFFALGGHSLLAVRLMNRIATLGTQLPLSALFSSPSLSAFAESISQHLGKGESSLAKITPISRDVPLPLSSAQKRLWFLSQLEGVSDIYHILMAFRFRGVLNQNAWQQALNALFARHEALRSVFVSVNGQPQVKLLPAELGIPIRWESLQNGSDVEAEVESLSAKEANAPFDLVHGPLVRAMMISLGSDEYFFMLTLHHIVSDGWSEPILFNELSALYASYCKGESDPLPPLTIQYPDYAAWQTQWLSGDNLESHSSYWRTTLANAPVLLNLPTDRPRPPQQSFKGDKQLISLDSQLTQALKQLSQRHGVTLHMTLLAAWSAVLSRLSSQDDIIIGSPSANRNHHQIESLIGFFVNTLALRIDLSEDPTIRQLLERVRRNAIGAQMHQDLPFEQVVDIVQPPRNMSHSPLFQVMFVWQNNESSEWCLPDIEATKADLSYKISKFDLLLQLFESGNNIVGNLEYSTALFDQSTMERHIGYLIAMLQAMVVNDGQAISSVQLLSESERYLLLQKWNANEKDYPEDQCIHQLFEDQVKSTPEATALVFRDQSLTYAELNSRANRLAHHLISLGVKPDMRVAICVERSLNMFIGILAILKAGGAYVPLDPTYPKDRLISIFEDATPLIMLADATGRSILSEEILRNLCQRDDGSYSAVKVVDPNDDLSSLDTNPNVSGLTSRHLAYVVYTSGSTGRPKGVMIEHQGVVSYALSRIADYSVDASSRFLQYSSLNFDLSVIESMPTFYSGASLHILDDRTRLDRDELWKYIERNSITQAVLPPAILQECKGCKPLSSNFTLISCGEALPAPLLRALHHLVPNGTIINEYGPTETAIGDVAWISPDPNFDGDIVPVGRPLHNKRLYILDKHCQPTPLGAVGELYIGGVGVARGYLNRPDLTAQVFLPDPFSSVPEARMYKTGDLAKYMPDGNLIFLGRNDHQVKIRGFRIELGEIEARLVDHPQVDKAIVLALEDGGNKRLVAYVVANPDDQLVNALRTHLIAYLPEYMIPAAIVRLDTLPLTPNGKVDRKALPAPDNGDFAREVYEAPQGEVETAIAHMWAELLRVDRVSRNDNFFALGGHSLLAVRLMNRIATLGAQLPLSVLFSSPSLSVFAESIILHIGQDQASLENITPISRDTTLPLSSSQKRLWFLSQLEGVSDIYHILMSFRFRGALNQDAWQQALNTLFARHESLRSIFITVNGQPQVKLLPAELGIPIRWESIQSEINVEAEVELLGAIEGKVPFDLEQGPLIRAMMVRISDDEHFFMLSLHHIVSDGWSSSIMRRELSALYTAYCNSEPNPLTELAIQYPDYAAWQNQWLSGDNLEAHSSYWRTVLDDAPVLLNLPTDRPRPSQQSLKGDSLPISINSQLTQALKELSKKHGVTLYMTVLAAWSAVLSRLSSQDDIIIGSPTANRNNQQIESLIGFFVNMLALRIDLSEHPTTSQLLERVRRNAIDAQMHQDLPFEQVVDIVQPPRNMSHTPLFQVMFAWQNNESSNWCLPDIETVEVDLAYEFAKFDLTLQLYESGDEIVGNLEYSTALFDRSTVERHIGYLITMLHAMTTDDEQVISSVPLISESERHLLLHTWNATEQDYPGHLCAHHLFEQHVEKAPDAQALVFMDQSLTYAQLNTHANQLSHHLISLGVGPDMRVAICVERSLAMIIGVLAILKAGGAYVPLDPAYASERLRDILSDSDPSIVLADESGRKALGEALISVTVVDPNMTLDSNLELERSNPEIQGLTSRHQAYVIYTSGSTGKPKGVSIEHWGVVNLAMTRVDAYGVNSSSRLAQFFSFGFDGSAMDIFTSYCLGASLHLLPDHIRYDLSQLWAYLDSQSITQALLPPAILQDWKGLHKLQTSLTIIAGGEALPPSLIRALQPLVPNGRVVNDYGPTEATVSSLTWKCPPDFTGDIVPIGRPIANKKLYLLDIHGQPVPLGAVGELYIGGAGVAREYLNRPELTAKVFLPDPFSSDPNARMYKTGDMAKYLPDGNVIFLGRSDHQVKIRGFRIELGEIESRLVDHPVVEKAAVIAVGEGSGRRLVAYVVAKPDDRLVGNLRLHLTSCLPDYMVPAAIVRLDSLPITSNGKLDRKALPSPDSDAFARETYEAPEGEIEILIANIWAELLSLDRVSRNDNFFALGGHSLLAVRLIEHLRREGLALPISSLFSSLTIRVLAQSVSKTHTQHIPSNLITAGVTTITPNMLPLVDICQSDIDEIIKRVSGGASNVQDIYALSPLQEGILLHHMLNTKGDPYLITSCSAFASRELLDHYFSALQKVVDRHDVLRTSFMWKGLSNHVQVVSRHCQLPVAEYELDPLNGPIKDQLMELLDSRHYRIDLSQAPLLRFAIAQDIDGRWIVVKIFHHLIGDHSTLETMNTEVHAFMECRGSTLPDPQPFRNLIAQERSGRHRDSHERFFKEMLSDITTPSLPFGMTDIYSQDVEVTKSYQPISQELNDRLRRQAKELGVSLASLCHLAWAQVISRTSGEDHVVFGTVLLGRMSSGPETDRAMGLFINMLPLRVDLDGSVRESVLKTHDLLASLLEHERAPLALAQQCSNVSQGLPLFSALLNYRHNAPSLGDTSKDTGIENLGYKERTNYPFALSVEDYGNALGLTMDIVKPYDSDRICGYMHQALNSLSKALDLNPDMNAHELDILSTDERHLLTQTWNETDQEYPEHLCIHQLFEQQVERTPESTALVFNGQSLTYADLNMQANQLSHHLISLGVGPDMRVAICVERSLAMIIGVLAILKAGGAYVPLDPAYASERLRDILSDSDPSIVLADESGRKALGEALISVTVVDPNMTLDSNQALERSNPEIQGLNSHHQAYIIYTSGSTGKPKGVSIEHQGVVSLVNTKVHDYGVDSSSRVAQFFSFGFDGSVLEIFASLSIGGSLHLLSGDIRFDLAKLWAYLDQNSITHVWLTPALLQDCKDLPELCSALTLIVAGETLSKSLIMTLQSLVPHGTIVNDYGPTETTVSAITWRCPPDFTGEIVPIGRPIANKKIYLLDNYGQPVPLGAVGELYIGGAGVAREYLNRPELTAKVFLPDPFSSDPNARMYKTGDMAKYLLDGNVVFLGRSDHQVKIRGFRIELGEIESRLVGHSLVEKAVVIAVGEGGDRRLVAYVVAKPNDQLFGTLRSYMSSCLPEYMVPAVFVHLDTLPLTSNGKLDLTSLPVPDSDSFTYETYVAPQGEIENAVAHIWTELLHVDRVSRNDNFFALGGHSLLAVRMITQVQSLLGFKTTLGAVFEAPTIAELVPRILSTSEPQKDGFDVILPIKPQGSRPPLFCIHPAFGLSWCYIGLSKVMPTEQPIYGLQARGFFDDSLSASTVHDMALDYIDEIRRIQTHGPYHLLGYSFGGKVAHAMAAHLERQGETVSLLAVMDATPYDCNLVESESQPKIDVNPFTSLTADSSSVDIASDQTKSFLQKVSDVRQAIGKLSMNHSPLSYSGNMILFRAMIQKDAARQPISFKDWEPYITGDIEVYDVDCEHDDMDKPGSLAKIGVLELNSVETKFIVNHFM